MYSEVKNKLLDPTADSSDEGSVGVKDEIDIDDSHYWSVMAHMKKEQTLTNTDSFLRDEGEEEMNNGKRQKIACKGNFPNPYVKLHRLEDLNKRVDFLCHSDIVDSTVKEIKKEIEDFLDAPMDVDNTQFKTAVKVENFEEAFHQKMTAVEEEKDLRLAVSEGNEFLKNPEFDPYKVINKEEASDTELYEEENAEDTQYPDNFGSTCAGEHTIGTVRNGQSALVANGEESTAAAANSLPCIQDHQQFYRCAHCSHQYKKLSDLMGHIRRMHSVGKQHKCDLIKFSCSDEEAFQIHCKKHKCEFCEYKSAQLSHLKRYLSTHTGEKPFSCELCDYKSAHLSDLKRHLYTHTKEKNLSCKFCEYKSSHLYDLKKHLRTHTGEKPFSCELCDYKSSQVGVLKRHLRTHTGEKPFSCKVCDYNASDSSALKKHLTIHKKSQK